MLMKSQNCKQTFISLAFQDLINTSQDNYLKILEVHFVYQIYKVGVNTKMIYFFVIKTHFLSDIVVENKITFFCSNVNVLVTLMEWRAVRMDGP